MQDDRQRMLVVAHFSHQIIRRARTARRQNAERHIKKRNPRIDLRDKQHAREGEKIKQPLNRLDLFAEKKNGDDRRKNRRQILKRHRRRQRNLLHRQKEKRERERSEKSAQEKIQTVTADKRGFRSVQTDETKNRGNRTAEKNDFQNWNVRNFLDENICQRKGERRKKHLRDTGSKNIGRFGTQN